MMEATFGLLQCFCSHSPPPPPPPPPAPHHILYSHPNYHQVFQGDLLLHHQSPLCSPQETKQSTAARERRRKITAKTQELGKLIPGTHNMNTAQMLQAASKYVKFLQAQLALLQQIQIIIPPPFPMADLSLLLASSAVQHKLYSHDKCLAPNQLLLHHLLS